MPFYEYRCPDCSQQFDMLRDVSQRDESTECPQCHGDECFRMLSLPVMFAETAEGKLQPVAGTSPGCGGCTATSCGGCPSSS